MYILLESTSGPIYTADIDNIDCMGSADNENDAMNWRNQNLDYRTYKYMPVRKNERS